MRVLLDATVLYAAPVRDLVLECVSRKMFSPHWSAAIHREWMRALGRNRPDIPQERIERLRNLMDSAFPEATVSRFDAYVQSFLLPDPDDRHVAAAAAKAGCRLILTSNVRHFPAHAMRSSGMTAIHPDKFLVRLADADAKALMDAAMTVRTRLRHQPLTMHAYCSALRRAGLPATAHWLGSQ